MDKRKDARERGSGGKKGMTERKIRTEQVKQENVEEEQDSKHGKSEQMREVRE